MLKTMFEQFIAEPVCKCYRIPKSDSVYSKYLIKQESGLVMIVEVDCILEIDDIDLVVLLINRGGLRIMSLKFY